MLKVSITLFFSMWVMTLGAQSPSTNFHPPLDIPLLISGTFGELRTNHFHAGIDLKTQGRSGLNVYAIDDGYVSRIKVSPWGYGKAIYITHPNGYTSVYAHLMRYHGGIQDYVIKNQYTNQSYSIELFPKPTDFIVKKGEVIGLSGNTGSSFAPHLHFEIRKSNNQNPLNTLHFNFDVKDDIPPIIKEIKLYPQTDYTLINGKNESLTLKVSGSNGNYNVDQKVVISGPYSLGISTYDLLNGANNKNGVYSVDMFVDSLLVYSHEMEEFSFKETKYINSHLDYYEDKANNKKFHKCFKSPNNPLSIYNYLLNNGIISPKNHQFIEFFVDDVYGNSSTLTLYIEHLETSPTNQTSLGRFDSIVFPFQQKNEFKKDSIRLSIPANALYDSISFEYKKTSHTNSDFYAPWHHIHTENIPLHYPFRLHLKTNVPEHLADKSFICKVKKNTSFSYIGGQFDNGTISATIKTFGIYSVAIDTIPPIVKGLTIFPGKKMEDSTLKMTIKDDVSGIKSYNAFIDDNWILMEYEPKKKRLTHYFKPSLKAGKHQFKLIVEDNVGNTSEYHAEFYR